MERHTEIEGVLCDRLGMTSCEMVGRGATALYALLKSLPTDGTKIIVPAIGCPAIAYPVLLAGYEIHFCDVSKSDFNLCLETLHDIDAAEVAALIAVHSFGHFLPMKDIGEWCRSNGVFLIEDACQYLNFDALELHSDAFVLSFGHTKPIDVGHGGALLTKELSVSEKARKHIEELPSQSKEEVEYYGDAYRKAYYSVTEQEGNYPPLRRIIGHLGSTFSPFFLSGFNSDYATRILDGLSRIQLLNQMRLQKSAILEKTLESMPVTLPNAHRLSVPWRYVFLVENNAEQFELTQHLRKNGIDASNWYPSLEPSFATGAGNCRNASEIENRIINLWVDERTSFEQVHLACDCVRKYFHSKLR